MNIIVIVFFLAALVATTVCITKSLTNLGVNIKNKDYGNVGKWLLAIFVACSVVLFVVQSRLINTYIDLSFLNVASSVDLVGLGFLIGLISTGAFDIFKEEFIKAKKTLTETVDVLTKGSVE